jgi:hypothetical protein
MQLALGGDLDQLVGHILDALLEPAPCAPARRQLADIDGEFVAAPPLLLRPGQAVAQYVLLRHEADILVVKPVSSASTTTPVSVLGSFWTSAQPSTGTSRSSPRSASTAISRWREPWL